MSGGIAYIWDPEQQFLANCNLGTVELEKVEAMADIDELQGLIKRHQEFTGSEIAGRILDRWQDSLAHFVKVMPTDYKRVLEQRTRTEVIDE
jgi:glutamate synthase domain-containing protein 3